MLTLLKWRVSQMKKHVSKDGNVSGYSLQDPISKKENLCFLKQSDYTEVKYQIIVAMEPGQLFKVDGCTEATFNYKLARVRKLFKGKTVFVRKQVIKTNYFESNTFVL